MERFTSFLLLFFILMFVSTPLVTVPFFVAQVVLRSLGLHVLYMRYSALLSDYVSNLSVGSVSVGSLNQTLSKLLKKLREVSDEIMARYGANRTTLLDRYVAYVVSLYVTLPWLIYVVTSLNFIVAVLLTLPRKERVFHPY